MLNGIGDEFLTPEDAKLDYLERMTDSVVWVGFHCRSTQPTKSTDY